MKNCKGRNGRETFSTCEVEKVSRPVFSLPVMVVPLAKVSELPEMRTPYRTGLQTAVLAGPALRWPEAVDILVRAEITQVAAAGSAASRFLGLPHEGEFALRRLVGLVGIDLGAGPLVYPGRNQADLLSVAEVLGSITPPAES
jgi:hypothetical protein